MEVEDQGATSTLPLKLFFLGFLLMFVGVILLVVATWFRGDGEVGGGLIVIVWFIPIILGAGPYAFFAILIAAILTIIAFVVFFRTRKQASKG